MIPTDVCSSQPNCSLPKFIAPKHRGDTCRPERPSFRRPRDDMYDLLQWGRTGTQYTKGGTVCRVAGLRLVRQRHETRRALNAVYRPDLLAEDRRDVLQRLYLDLDDDVIRAHHLVQLHDVRHLRYLVVYVLGLRRVCHHENVCFYDHSGAP